MDNVLSTFLVAFNGILAYATARLVVENRKLWEVARETADTAKRSAETAYQEFLLSHLPFVVAKNFTLDWNDDLESYHFRFDVVDVAGVPVVLDRFRVKAYVASGSPSEAMETGNRRQVHRDYAYRAGVYIRRGKKGPWHDPELIWCTLAVDYHTLIDPGKLWTWTAQDVCFRASSNGRFEVAVDPGGWHGR